MGYGKRKSIVTVGEPTVTINTKEALADVFGMYNSPDKTVKRMMPGSKHAPVKRIEPMTPATRQTSPVVHVENNENAKTPGKCRDLLCPWGSIRFLFLKGAFKPFVDENANRKENSTPAAKVFIYCFPSCDDANLLLVQALRG
jgi:checkpoint serine/threonine-protein kinase